MPAVGCYKPASSSRSARSPHERRKRLQWTLHSLGFKVAYESEAIVVWAPPSARKLEHDYWLQAIKDTVRRNMMLPIPNRRLIVVRCTRRADSARVTAAAKLARFPRHAIGAYYRSIDVAIVLDTSTCHVTLCHEVVHWVLAHAVPDCPPALDEGLAQLLSEKALAPDLQRIANEAYEQGHSPELIVRHTISMHRESRLCRLAEQHDRFDLFALCHAGPKAVYGPGAKARRIRDLSFCFASVLNEKPEAAGMQLPEVLKRIQRANHAGDALASLRTNPKLEPEWLNTIKSYRAPRFTPQR